MRDLLSRRDAPLVGLLFVLCAAGVVLRFIDLGFPPGLTWDEKHFVDNARNYLNGAPDWNDHPPLGKLLMALSISRLGDTSFAFRLPSAILGCVAILSGAGLARAVFKSDVAGLLAGAFIAADGFFICYSRTALLDGMLTAFSLLALWAMTARGPWAVVASGLLIGTGMAIKMSALVLFGPLLAIAGLQGVMLSERARSFLREPQLFGRPLRVRATALWAVLPATGLGIAVYLWWWTVGLGLAGQPNTFGDAMMATRKMMDHHAGLTDWEHPLLSRWWTWAVPTTPIMLRRDVVDGGMVRAMTSMGNPLLWWGAVAAVLAGVVQTLRAKRGHLAGPLLGRAWLLLAFLGYLFPWMVTNRDSYIYHYLPAYAVGVVLLAGALAQLATTQARRNALLGFVCCVTLVTVFYAPVWAQLPISESALKLRPLIK